MSKFIKIKTCHIDYLYADIELTINCNSIHYYYEKEVNGSNVIMLFIGQSVIGVTETLKEFESKVLIPTVIKG